MRVVFGLDLVYFSSSCPNEGGIRTRLGYFQKFLSE
jgi:hypothetical protein